MTPEQTLRAAAEHVIGPYRPIDDGYLAEAIADWLKATAQEMSAVDGTEYANAEFASWTAALAVARQILGDQT